MGVTVKSVEEITFLDPAMGSGHILLYAFELLHAMYEEEGYPPAEIPGHILSKNLFGIEIDDRAGALAGFALMMKARRYYRRFLRKPIQPNLLVMQDIHFNETELDDYCRAIDHNLFTANLKSDLQLLTRAKNFGALIRPTVADVDDILTELASKPLSGDLFWASTHERVVRGLTQLRYLQRRYHCVVTNPPYMGSKGMNAQLSQMAKDDYPDSKSDLFAIFIQRCLEFAAKNGLVAMITMQSWMFLSSYEKLRANLLDQNTIMSMAHLGPRAFDTIGGEVVSTTAFVLEKAHHPDHKGSFLRLIDGNSEAEKEAMFLEVIAGLKNLEKAA